MEIIKNIYIDFILFSLIESFYYFMFMYYFNKSISNLNIKYKYIILIGLINAIVYNILKMFDLSIINILYIFIIMPIFANLMYKISLDKLYKSMFLCYSLMIILETISSVVFNYFYNIEIIGLPYLVTTFIALIHSKAIEFLVIYFIKRM